MAGGKLLRGPRRTMRGVRVQLIDPSGGRGRPTTTRWPAALARARRRGRADHLALRARPRRRRRTATRCDPLFYRLATRCAARRPAAPARAASSPSTCPTCCACAARGRAPTSGTTSGSRSRRSTPGCCRPAGRACSRSHNVLRARAASTRRARSSGMDALVVHTRAGAELLAARHGVPPERVRTIPHGAFEHLTRQPGEAPLPAGAARASRGRSCCASASCARTREWTCCSRPSARWTAPSCGWSGGRWASRWSGCGASRRRGGSASCRAT